MIGCSNEINTASNTNKSVTVQTQAEVAQNNLRIINSQTTLNHGGMGYITVQGKAKTQYTLLSSFKVGNRVVDVTQWRITGDSGQATFNWIVSPETVPGTYDIFISGGGERLNLSHTVLQ
jgi:hypothetical protein